jgi:Mrp family chromosome partitioning ATPase
MTTTNQAFIKAYRTDEPQSEPANPTISVAGGPHAHGLHGPGNRTVAVSATSSDRSAIYGPRPRDARRVPSSADHPHPGPLPEGERARAGEKRPLSSFIASTGIGRLSSERAESEFLRPGTTVASFQWPEVCRTLLRSCPRPLDHVADLLITHAAAGRSLVGVLAMSPGDGATTTVLCLASRLAERRRAIVVDANFHKPRLAKWLEAEPTSGWQDVLKHGAPLSDAVVRSQDDRLDLLALGEKIPNDASRLVGGLQAVVTAGVLRHAYDHVLLDVGSFGDSTWQPLQLDLLRNMGIDAVIAVTRSGSADARAVNELAGQLSRSGCEFLGIIENRIARPQAA